VRLSPSDGWGPRLLQLRRMMWPILETAGAAVVAWYLAKLLLGDRETGFAPIAAVICLGATLGQQRERALELIGGVILGVSIADLLTRLIGTGVPQVGLMIVLAMSAAVLVGGGAMLMTEAGVSAIIIGQVPPETLGLFPVRPIEGLIGGAVAFAVHLFVFPPDPLLLVARAANTVIDTFGTSLQHAAAALRSGDRERAERAVESARRIDGDLAALGESLAIGRETARTAPLRRAARAALDRQEEVSRHLAYTGRDIQVLARDAMRLTRGEGASLPDVADAVGDLAGSVWALGAALDDPDEALAARGFALRAMSRATEATVRHADHEIIEAAGHVRATAVDLARAAQAVAPRESRLAAASTEELLAAPVDVPDHGAPPEATDARPDTRDVRESRT
jgi:uncharacterized membrane protein YgaE (UPF0421/DUF939 family)